MTGKSGEKGFILVTAFLMLMSLSAFAAAIFMQHINFFQTADRNQKKITAFNFSEAGFDTGFRYLKTGTVSTFPYNSSYVSMNSGAARGGYDLTITDMGGGVHKIVSRGYSPAQTSASEAVENRDVTGYVKITNQPIFEKAVFGTNTVVLDGPVLVDSYDSSLGSYGGTNIGIDGHVATDATAAASVTLKKQVIVNGNMTTGVGSNPSTVISNPGGAAISGIISAATSVVSPQTISSSIPSSGSLNLSGSTTYTLSTGTYRFDSISLSGSATLQATGPVTIYVDGAITFSGNVSTSSSKPGNMLIYVTGTSDATLSGSVAFYGALYAPNATVNVSGSGDIYGAVVAKNYNHNGSGDVHYDTSLQSAASVKKVSILTWKESLITDPS